MIIFIDFLNSNCYHLKSNDYYLNEMRNTFGKKIKNCKVQKTANVSR